MSFDKFVDAIKTKASNEFDELSDSVADRFDKYLNSKDSDKASSKPLVESAEFQEVTLDRNQDRQPQTSSGGMFGFLSNVNWAAAGVFVSVLSLLFMMSRTRK